MTKHLFFVLFILVAVALMAIPGGDVAAQDELQCSQPYTVQAGDWLSTIAVRYNVSTNRLAQINGITDPNTIQVGQVICLTEWVSVAGGVAAIPAVDTRVVLPVIQPTTMPQYVLPAAGSTSFNTADPQVKDPSAVDPAHRGVWESKHWFLLIASIILVTYNIRVRWNGSKQDLIGAIACVAFAFVMVFVPAGDHGHWIALVVYLTMLALSHLGDDDLSSMGLMCLLIAIIASFFGKMRLLGIDPDVSLRSIQDLPAMWAELNFSDMTLSAGIYLNLIAALLIFGRELWAELREVGEAARDMSMPSNWNEVLGDVANFSLTALILLVWGII